MRYTNKEMIATLRKVLKSTLWNGNSDYCTSPKTRFVCFAIRRALGEYEVPLQFRRLVRAHIGNYEKMEDFLGEKLGKSEFAKLSYKDIQTYRFMMVNNMIKMIEAKEAQ